MASESIDKARITNLKDVSDVLIRYLTCKLCKKISLNPRIDRTCENIFCKECLRIYFKEQGEKICPMKCEHFVKTRLSKLERANLSSIIISCKNKENGCPHNFSYSSVDQLVIHEKECGFNKLICPKCRKIVVYNNFAKHEQYCVREFCKNCEDYLNSNECHAKTNKRETQEIVKRLESCEEVIHSLKQENDLLKSELSSTREQLGSKIQSLETQVERCINLIGEYKIITDETKLSICELKLENSSLKKALQKLELNNDSQRRVFEDNVIKLSSMLSDRETQQKQPKVNTNYSWDRWGKIYNHNLNKCVFSVRTQNYLPNHFKARVRVKPTGVLGWYVVGLTRVYFNTDGKQFMWHNKEVKDCYVYNSNGYKSDSYRPAKYGEEYTFNDVISVVYDKSKNISFEKNGRDLGIAFENVEGPFYLAASMYFNGDGAELLDVTELD